MAPARTVGVTVFADSALAYADQGLPVFPLKPGGKVPLTQHGLDDATTDHLTIDTWWTRYPNANVAIRTGELIVIDEDQPGAFSSLCARHQQPLPQTRVASTGTGRHYYFKPPPGAQLRNTAGKLAPGIDTRASGGYVVAPPSIHPNGTPYLWETDIDPVKLPGWLAALLAKPENVRQPAPPLVPGAGAGAYARRALEAETYAVATAPEGTRNHRLNTAAFNLGQLVAGGELDEWDVRNALRAVARACGLPDKEAEATLESGLSSGLEHPRRAPEPAPQAAPRLTVVPNGDQAAPDQERGEPAIRLVDLAEFASVEEPGAQALAGDEQTGALIPEDGDIMFYGDGGAGKTTLAVDLACHLATATDWLGIPINAPVRVLLIENEGPRPLFRQKLRRKHHGWQGPDLAGRVTVLETPWATLSFADPLWRTTLAAAVAEHQLDVVIVGPVTRAGMNDAGTLQEVRDFMTLVGNVRELAKRRVCFILIHHENKGGQVSGAWEGAGDTLLHVQGQGHGRTRLFIQKARWSTTLHSTSMNLLWADGESFTVEDKPDLDDDTLAEQILAAVSEHSGAGWNTVLEATKGNAARKKTIRDQLLASGRIVNRGGRGAMKLYTAGDPQLQAIPDPESVGNRSDSASGVGDQPQHPPSRLPSDGGDAKAAHAAPEELQWS